MKDFLIKEALNKFDQNQIKYCVFKSSDHLLAGIKGHTDVDLLIEEEKINSALKELKELGFKITKPSHSVINPYRFGLIAFCEKASKLVYLDIMTRFVVGINRARQVRSLDIARNYLSFAKANQENIYTLPAEKELECLFLRIISKSANGIPFFDAGGYNLQLKYLLSMFKQMRFNDKPCELFTAFTYIRKLASAKR